MPLACSRRHLGGSEPMHQAPQLSPSFLGGLFKEKLAHMNMETTPAWFHWSFLFLVNLAALHFLSFFLSTKQPKVWSSPHTNLCSSTCGLQRANLCKYVWQFLPLPIFLSNLSLPFAVLEIHGQEPSASVVRKRSLSSHGSLRRNALMHMWPTNTASPPGWDYIPRIFHPAGDCCITMPGTIWGHFMDWFWIVCKM